MKIIPPHIYQFFIVLMIGVYFFVPSSILISFPYYLIGIVPLLFGLYMVVSSKNVFKKAGTPIHPSAQPTQLQTKRFFKYSRNPIYLGISIALLGIAIITGSILNLLFPPLFLIIMNYVYVPPEEKKLEKTFGDQFTQYKSKNRRWI